MIPRHIERGRDRGGRWPLVRCVVARLEVLRVIEEERRGAASSDACGGDSTAYFLCSASTLSLWECRSLIDTA